MANQGESQRSIPPLIPEPEVLIVDDEENVAEMHAYRVERKYKALVATGGNEALDAISTNTDIVILDRRMPKLSGDEVLDKIRDQGYNCQVVMVTAINAGEKINELDFDDYITKPIGDDTLLRAIEEQLDVKRLNIATTKLISTQNKIEVMEEEHSQPELDDNEEYAELTRKVNHYQEKVEELEQKTNSNR